MDIDRAQELLDAGYKREPIMWSFTPRFYHKDGGHYYSKFVTPAGEDQREIGLVLNEEYDSVEAFTCECNIGCCGYDLGIIPFNLEKIHAIIDKHYED